MPSMYRRWLPLIAADGLVRAAVAASIVAGAASTGHCDDVTSLQTMVFGRAGVASTSPEGGGKSFVWPKREDAALAAKMTQEDLTNSCSTVFLAALIDLGGDFVHRGAGSVQRFSYMERYYRSILALRGSGVRSVIVHNNLSSSFIGEYSTPDGAVSFAKVDLSKMSKALHPVEWRFFVMFDQIRKHPEWDTVFLTDINGVVVHHNPCHFAHRQSGKVFVGVETVAYGSWMPTHYYKYLDWYTNQPHNASRLLLNAGVLGGESGVLEKLGDKFEVAMLDPNLAIRKGQINYVGPHPYYPWVDMPMFDYILHAEYPGDFVTGYPLLDRWASHRYKRTDVYISHK